MSDIIARGMAGDNSTTLAAIAQYFGVKALVQFKEKSFTATEGQTVFDISDTGSYIVGAKAIEVWVGSVYQRRTVGYNETSSTVFTLTSGASAGTIVFARWCEPAWSANNFVAVSGNKTLALTDAETTQNVTAASIITVPLNATVAFPIGTEIVIKSKTANEVSIAAVSVGVTINYKTGLKINGQHAAATLKKEGTDEWWLVGDLKA